MAAGKSARRHLRVGTALSNGVRMTPPLPPSRSRLAGQEFGTGVKCRLRPGENLRCECPTALQRVGPPRSAPWDRNGPPTRGRSLGRPRAARRQPTHPRCSGSDQAYFAASTNSLVQVLVRSIVLPWTFLL